VQVPVVRLSITNQGRYDLTPPEVTALRADTAIWKAGSTHRIFLRAIDDVSGIDVKQLECLGGLSNTQVGPSGYASHAGTCGEARAEGDSW
ncbi:hypothetical protein, partial [Enterococcus faecalis]|uniref:hypothetical protein n=1 Tax=Enterococcus faecalis TaxID=1351 RepID=UPI00403F1AB6